MSPPGMTIRQAADAARGKLEEASFFLEKLHQTEAGSHENLADAGRHFSYYLSAFLSAARSVPQVLKEVVGWGPIDATRNTWTPEEQKVERTLKNARDLSVHWARGAATSTVRFVPNSDLPSRQTHPLDGHVFIRRPPGVPEPRAGVMRFTLQIDGQERPAVECCRQYLGLLDGIVAAIEASGLTPPA